MDTLLLDAGYTPVAAINWQKAVTLIFLGKAEVIEEYEDRTVRSVTLEIKIPSIIRFVRAIRGKKKELKFTRENIYLRDRGRCMYCEKRLARSVATYDHVVPRAWGGKTEWTNIVLACMECNQKKGNRTPELAKMKLLVEPVRPRTLPENLRLTITWRKSMPYSWKQFLLDSTYWDGELDSE